MASRKTIGILAGIVSAGVLCLTLDSDPKDGVSGGETSSPRVQSVSQTVSSPASHRPYALEHTQTIEASGVDGTAYFIFQRHQTSTAAQDPAALVCQFLVYRKLEEVVNAGIVSSIFVEGFNKRENIAKEYPNIVLTPELKAHPEAMNDAYLLDVLTQYYEFEGLFSKFYEDKVYFTGWEEKSPAVIEREMQRFRAYDELEARVRTGEVKPGSSAYQQYVQETEALQEYLKETVSRRSEQAYFNSLEMARERQGEQKMNYAVVIGKAHKEDIMRIIAEEKKHPAIEVYECPSTL